MHKPNSLIQRRNIMFRSAYYCAEIGQCRMARKLMLKSKRDRQGNPMLGYQANATPNQRAAVQAVSNWFISSRPGRISRTYARFWSWLWLRTVTL